MARCFALIPAAGSGSRMGSARPKQYLDLLGRPLIAHCLGVFESHPEIAGIAVVISAADEDWNTYDWSSFSKISVFRCGGASRAETVRNGLAALAAAADDWVLVHDAARPGLSSEALNRLLAIRDDAVGGLLALPVADTLKRQLTVDPQRIAGTVAREGLWSAQTPQMFRYGLLRRALESSGPEVTDEASAVESLGLAPRLVEGDPANLKVTRPADLALAERWLRQ